MTRIDLPYGKIPLSFDIPERWLAEVVQPQPVPPCVDVPALVRTTLAQPTGSPALRSLALPGQSVAILMDDFTRRTPIRLMLPPVLEELAAAGVKTEDIRLVIAPGSHRLMNPQEIRDKLGEQISAQFPIVSISSGDQAKMSYLGRTSGGIPAWVNRVVVESDLRIGLGSITPHMDAGFSGGAKIVLPGACGTTTVDAFHARQMDDPDNQLGNPAAPLRLDLERFVAEHHLLDFIVNVVTTPDEQVYRCVAGEMVAAHRLGIQFARQAYGASVKRRYPVVIASSYPHHHDLWQSIKGLWSGDLMTADGGTLILAAQALEGHSSYPLLPAYLGRQPALLRGQLGANRLKDPKSAATALMVQRRLQRMRVALITDAFSPADIQRMGFEAYPTIEVALDATVHRLPLADQEACVSILMHGGTCLPILPKSELK